VTADGLLGRLRIRYSEFLEPEVERSPRRERWRRHAWEALSTVAAAAVGIGPAIVLVQAFGPFVALGVYALAVTGWIDANLVFPWGIERFGIEPPAEFREVAEDVESDDQEGSE